MGTVEVKGKKALGRNDGPNPLNLMEIITYLNSITSG